MRHLRPLAARLSGMRKRAALKSRAVANQYNARRNHFVRITETINAPHEIVFTSRMRHHIRHYHGSV